MSGRLAPSKSTVYVSNLPFSLTNNDVHKIFEKYGKVVKVTILKGKSERRSRGVAFVLFLARESVYPCVQALNNTEMFGRTLKVSVAKDNGRAPEFIRRKEYKDKSRCYECGDEGHLSYRCPKNLLGDRQPPVKKKKRGDGEEGSTDSDSGDEAKQSAQDSLAQMLQYQERMSVVSAQSTSTEQQLNRKKYKKNEYFSDEEELGD